MSENSNTIMRNVDEPITQKERSELTDEFLKLDYQYDVTDAAMKRSKKQFEAQKDELEGKINSIKDTLRTGKLTRQVECRVRYLPAEGKKDVIRVDKEEVVTTETMTRKDFDDYQEAQQLSIEAGEGENQENTSDGIPDEAPTEENPIHVGMVFRKESDDSEEDYEYASVIEIGDDDDPITVRLEGREDLETLEELSKFGWEPDPDFHENVNAKDDIFNE